MKYIDINISFLMSCKPYLNVLTQDQEDHIQIEGFEIQVIPVWKWLLLRQIPRQYRKPKSIS